MSWVIWITGLPGSGKTTLARAAVQALASRGIRVSLIEFPEIYRSLVPEPHGSEAEYEVVHRALVSMARALSDSGVPVVVDAAAPRRAWRDLARRTVRCFAEVQLTCPPEVCGARERAARWGLVAGGGPRPGTAAPPELATAYEYSLRPDLTIPTDLKTIWIAVDEVVRLALGLHRQVSALARD
jgi:adenylylsulfate kinase